MSTRHDGHGPCPLCGHPRSRTSWFGSLRYLERDFPYSECTECATVFCDPMPDSEVVARMYGVDYMGLPPAQACVDDPKRPDRLLDVLRDEGSGTFLDYGCGNGSLLAAAQRLGWLALGVEYDPEVAARVTERTGARVVSAPADIGALPGADVLHLGDVVEHLTAPEAQLLAMLDRINPGGLLVAQGPLEANASLFTQVLKWARRVRRGANTEMPPYHVLLATARGQLRLFERIGLETVRFDVTEVDWPAPSRLRLRDLMRPRETGLWLLRRASRVVSALGPAAWGNRYFYVGRKG